MLHDVLVRIGWIAQLASSIAIVVIIIVRGTVDQFLLGQMDVGVVSEGEKGLNRGGGRERPTRPTAALLFDWLEASVLAPVKVRWQLLVLVNDVA